MPAVPPTYDDAVIGPDAEGWIASMRDKSVGVFVVQERL